MYNAACNVTAPKRPGGNGGTPGGIQISRVSVTWFMIDISGCANLGTHQIPGSMRPLTRARGRCAPSAGQTARRCRGRAALGSWPGTWPRGHCQAWADVDGRTAQTAVPGIYFATPIIWCRQMPSPRQQTIVHDRAARELTYRTSPVRRRFPCSHGPPDRSLSYYYM
jgi:hypothetical protein